MLGVLPVCKCGPEKQDVQRWGLFGAISHGHRASITSKVSLTFCWDIEHLTKIKILRAWLASLHTRGSATGNIKCL